MLARPARIIVLLWALGATGCRISREIVDVEPPPDQSRLQALENHLDYTDPDAGQPDYVRTD